MVPSSPWMASRSGKSEKKISVAFLFVVEILIWLNEMEVILFLILRDFTLFRYFQLLQHRSLDQWSSFWEAKNGDLHWPHLSFMLLLELHHNKSSNTDHPPLWKSNLVFDQICWIAAKSAVKADTATLEAETSEDDDEDGMFFLSVDGEGSCCAIPVYR